MCNKEAVEVRGAILFSFILVLEHFGSQQREGKMGKGEMLQGVMTLKGTLGRNVTGRHDTQRDVRAK